MDTKAATKPGVCKLAQELVRLAEDKFATGGAEYNMLCDAAHEVDQLHLRAQALESRAQQLEGKIYAMALILRP